MIQVIRKGSYRYQFFPTGFSGADSSSSSGPDHTSNVRVTVMILLILPWIYSGVYSCLLSCKQQYYRAGAC